MKYTVELHGRSFTVELQGDGEVLVAEGEEQPRRRAVAFEAIHGASALWREGSASRPLHCFRDAAGRGHVLFPGRPPLRGRVHDEHSLARAGDGPSQAESLICSAMPGIILDTRVAEGDAVEKGQVLLILEAMKTENEICAELDGRVKTVFVKAGQTIQSDAPLIELEPAEEG